MKKTMYKPTKKEATYRKQILKRFTESEKLKIRNKKWTYKYLERYLKNFAKNGVLKNVFMSHCHIHKRPPELKDIFMRMKNGNEYFMGFQIIDCIINAIIFDK